MQRESQERPFVEFGDTDPIAHVSVDIASTPQQRERGLQGRPSLEPDQGMLFVFPTEVQDGFWSANIGFALDVGIIGADGALLEILNLKPGDERPRMPDHAYQYALEVQGGWFREHCVELGQRMRFVSTEGPVRVS